MNQADLLDQFVIESRECLEAIGQRLLEVERDPADGDLLNDLFRSVHTLKGNCGLFEFKPLEQVVHAGEDLLDRVRNRSLAYSPELADALLAAMDFSAEMIDQIERHGRIDDSATKRAVPLAAALRELITQGLPAAEQAPAQAGPAPTQPDWLQARFSAEALYAAPGAVALRYQPEPDCFFKGEDPWRLACTAPGLVQVQVASQEPWPEGEALDAFDCYRCNLDIVLLSTAPQAELEAHFRCVPEQVEVFALPALSAPDAAQPPAPLAEAASAAQAQAERRAAALWADQIDLLGRNGLSAGAVAGAANSLRGLLCLRADAPAALVALEALRLPLSGAALLSWAMAHSPAALHIKASAAATKGTAPTTGTATARSATPATVPGSSDGGPPAPRGTPDEGGSDRPQRVLKVGQEKIDRLMDLIGEMVVAKNSLPYLAQRAEAVFGQRELAREIKAQYAVINRIAEDMQTAIMQVRMLPVGTVFQRFGRLVRDISKKLGKEVQLVIEGEETEADKNVIEALADPLIHLVRNSLDHGIATPEVRLKAGKPALGTIRIAARQEGDRVLIEISDDGAGVDPDRVRAKAVERGLIPADRASTLSDDDAVQLVFLPGFSTAAEITDLSGRGVGMDVVRNAVERLNGTVALSSRKGHGTTVRLSLPLSMAVSHVMVVESAGRRFGVPMDMINETVRVHADDIHHFKQARTTVLRGRVVPLRPLNDVLALDALPLLNSDGEYAVLVVRLATGNVGLLVDHFHGASDIILKPLEGVLAGLTGFAGTALMGDGSVLMVLNPKELI
jgi:two-component system chemotaxis sensor kinase CheA